MKKMKQAQKSYMSLNTLKMYLGLNGEDYWHIDYPEYGKKYDGTYYYWDLSKKAEMCEGPFDEKGILEFVAQDNKKYKHVINMCHYAIGAYEIFLRNNDEPYKETFLKHAEWLCENQEIYHGINGVWVNHYPIYLYNIYNKSVSGMTQGMGISVLTRAFRLTGNKKYLDYAEKAVEIFGMEIREGGILRIISEKFICYEEYSTLDAPSCVLNGFITALLGLFDLILLNQNSKAKEYYNKGLQSLILNLTKWDCKIWSLYDLYSWNTKNYASLFYHKYHIKQLNALYAVTNEVMFLEYSQKWEKYLKNKVFRMFALIKKITFRLNGRL